MDQITPFITFLAEHWLLTSAFVLIVVLFIINELRHRSFGITDVNAQELVDLLNHAQGVVIDVRTPAQFQQGHILGALNLPQAEFVQRLNILNKYKGKPILLVCSGGLDSPKMGKILAKKGFTQLYYLSGGIDLWYSQGMPLVKK